MDALTIAEACSKYGIDQKKLAGRLLRNDIDDPILIDQNASGEYLVLDDWRLSRLRPLPLNATV